MKINELILQAEKFNRTTLPHHTSTPSLNTIGNGFKSNSVTSLSSTTHSNFISNKSNSITTPKTTELKADEQLRKILSKDSFETENDSKKWGNLNNVKRRPSVPASMLNHNSYNRSLSNNANGNLNGIVDGDDEILENLVKSATNQNRLENKKKTKSVKIDRKSCK